MPIDRDDNGDSAVARFRAAMDEGIDEDFAEDVIETEPHPQGDVYDLDDPGLSRSDKKRARGALYSALKEKEKELEELRAANLQREKELSEIRGMAMGMQQRQPAAQGPDPIDSEWESLAEEQRRLFAEYRARASNGGMSDDEQAEFDKRNSDIERRKYTVIARGVVAQSQNALRENLLSEVNQNNVQSRYPDIFSDQRALAWARGRYSQKRAEGHPESWDTMDAVAEETRAQFGKNTGKPSAGMRAKFSGSGGGAAGGGNSFRMTELDKRLADARYGHLPETERYRKYADSVGRALVEKKLR